VLTGAATQLTGNELANTLYAGVLGARLNGGAGNDVLIGGSGADQFVFDTALDAANNVDRIAGYAAGDHLQLSAAVYTNLGPAGALAADHYYSGAGLSGSTSAAQGAGIYHDTATGSLYYDADGYGGAAALKFAVISGHPALAAGDILIG
jgi:Ca2+-binding RTX toxin-like protein